MKMVAMGGVVVRSQHAVENTARAIAHFAQEKPVCITAPPIALDAYAPAFL